MCSLTILIIISACRFAVVLSLLFVCAGCDSCNLHVILFVIHSSLRSHPLFNIYSSMLIIFSSTSPWIISHLFLIQTSLTSSLFHSELPLFHHHVPHYLFTIHEPPPRSSLPTSHHFTLHHPLTLHEPPPCIAPHYPRTSHSLSTHYSHFSHSSPAALSLTLKCQRADGRLSLAYQSNGL